MAANSRTASAVQILCVMAHLGDGITSQVIANSLRTNPVVVRRLLKCLEQARLVSLRPGKDGGVHFVVAPDYITLDEVYKAVEPEGDLFAMRANGNSKCRVYRGMKRLLPPIFASANEAVANVLRQTTIGSLTQSIH